MTDYGIDEGTMSRIRMPTPEPTGTRAPVKIKKPLTASDKQFLADIKTAVQEALTPTEPTKITVALLKAADSTNSDEYYTSLVDSLNQYAEIYEVNTPLRVAHFLSQIAVESGFKLVEENGNYSAARMREIFGCKGGSKNYIASTGDCSLGRLREKLWTEEATYAHNAKKLLSYVYGARLGNGNEVSGDGYKYRGRGMIQLTGKDNYQAFTTKHNSESYDEKDFVGNPDLLLETTYGVEAAFFFWDSNKINALADSDNVTKVTLAVNGGSNGLADREGRLKAVKKALGI
jgi:predicted chitinase